MAQVFDRSSNALARMSLVLTGLIVIALGVALDQLQRSPWVTRQGQRPDQPIPFSHKHHVEGLGLQCQYCHTQVEKAAYAGVPPTKTCINCHSQIWTNAELLEPARQSWATGASIQWTRVHDLPDYVYFNHSIHVNKGIGCASCHGRVDEMPLMYQQNTLADGVVPKLPPQPGREPAADDGDLQHGVGGTVDGQARVVRGYEQRVRARTTAQQVSCTTMDPTRRVNPELAHDADTDRTEPGQATWQGSSRERTCSHTRTRGDRRDGERCAARGPHHAGRATRSSPARRNWAAT